MSSDFEAQFTDIIRGFRDAVTMVTGSADQRALVRENALRRAQEKSDDQKRAAEEQAKEQAEIARTKEILAPAYAALEQELSGALDVLSRLKTVDLRIFERPRAYKHLHRDDEPSIVVAIAVPGESHGQSHKQRRREYNESDIKLYSSAPCSVGKFDTYDGKYIPRHESRDYYDTAYVPTLCLEVDIHGKFNITAYDEGSERRSGGYRDGTGSRILTNKKLLAGPDALKEVAQFIQQKAPHIARMINAEVEKSTNKSSPGGPKSMR